MLMFVPTQSQYWPRISPPNMDAIFLILKLMMRNVTPDYLSYASHDFRVFFPKVVIAFFF